MQHELSASSLVYSEVTRMDSAEEMRLAGPPAPVGTPAPETAAAGEPRRVVSALRTVNSVAFLSLMGFSILLPSLWPRLQEHGSTHQFFGMVLASYCVGQIIGSLGLGWAVKGGFSFKMLLFVSLVCEGAGYVVYVASNNPWAILASRMVCGAGAGNVSLSRTIVTALSKPTFLTERMSHLTAAQALGFVFGPLAGTLLGYVSIPQGWKGNAVLDEYTLPAWFALLLVLLNCLSVALYFTDAPPKKPDPLLPNPDEEAGRRPVKATDDDSDASSKRSRSRGQHSSMRSSHRSSASSRSAIMTPSVKLVFFLCFFVELMVFSLAETTMVPTTTHYYHWTVRNNGVLWAACGFVCVIPLLNMKRLNSLLSSRVLFLVGMTLHIGCLCLMSSWRAVAAGFPFGATVAPPEIPRIAAGMVLLVGVAHPVAMVNLITMFASSVPEAERGPMMGMLQTFGSLGRIVGPLVGGFAMDGGELLTQGLTLLYLGVGALILLVMLLFVCRVFPKIR